MAEGNRSAGGEASPPRPRPTAVRRQLWSPEAAERQNNYEDWYSGPTHEQDQPLALGDADYGQEEEHEEPDNTGQESQPEKRMRGSPPPGWSPQAQRFQYAVMALSEEVHTHLQTHGVVQPECIRRMASASVERYTCPATGNEMATVITAETNFALGVSREIPSCKQGSMEWATVVELHMAATENAQAEAHRPSTRGEYGQQVDPLTMYPGKEPQEELQKAESMTIRGDYRKAALDKLNAVWKHKILKSCLPGYRLWGMVMRQKWVYGEFQPIDFWLLQNAEQGRYSSPKQVSASSSSRT